MMNKTDEINLVTPENSVYYRKIETIALEILSLDKQHIKDFNKLSFIQLGGDSIKAMYMVSQVEQETQINMPIGSLLSKEFLSTVITSSIESYKYFIDNPISNENESIVNSIKHSSEMESLATHGQQGMWIMQELLGNSAYNLVFNAQCEGTINISFLRKSIFDTVARHESLCTYFCSSEIGLRPIIQNDFVPPFEIIETDKEGFNSLLQQTRADIKNYNFQFGEEPPVKFILITDGDKQHSLFFFTHHMLVDGWSIGIVLNEIFKRYHAFILNDKLILPPAPSPNLFINYQEELRDKGVFKKEIDYWRNALKGFPTTLEFKTDKERPKQQSVNGVRHPYHFSTEDSEDIVEFAKKLGVTPFAVFLSAYSLLISRYTGNRKFILGVPSAGRPTLELRDLVGLCTNLVPVPIDINEEISVGNFIKDIQSSLANTLNNSNVPFDELIREIGIGGDSRRNPLTQFVFAMHDQLIERELEIEDLQIKIEDGHGGASPFDMTFFIQYSSPFFGGELEYSSDVFNESEVKAFINNFNTIVREITGDVEKRVGNIRGISLDQLKRLEILNDTKQLYHQESIEQLFLKQVDLTPDSKAVIDPSNETFLTYSELEHVSTVQANKLVESGVKQSDFVIVALDRSIEEIVALLGILRAGAVYVAVDPQWPNSRIAQIINVCKPSAIIVSEDNKNRFQTLIDGKDIQLIKTWKKMAI